MDFGCETTLCFFQGLVLPDPPFYPSARMCSDDGGIDHDTFHVSIVSEILEHCTPNSPFSPSVKPFVNSVPVTIFFGEESPLSTTAGHPEDGVDKAFAVADFSDVKVCSGFEKCKNSFPLSCGDFDVGHNELLLILNGKVNTA
jgi:hypothetical protein